MRSKPSHATSELFLKVTWVIGGRLARYEVSWNMTVNIFFWAKYARQIGSGKNSEFKLPFCAEEERDRGVSTAERPELGDGGTEGLVEVVVEVTEEMTEREGVAVDGMRADLAALDCVRNLAGGPLG